jgi:nitrite reductase (NADH) large subunit
MRQRLIIVGAGMAAAYLLQELAGVEHRLQITVIGDEPDACYNRVMLSGVLAGETAEADLQMLASTNLLHAAQFLTGTRVSSVNLQKRTLVTDTGEHLPYDLLVFATGATVAMPDIAVSGINGIEVLRTLQDVRRLRSVQATGRRAVVVGGGLLGLEAAHGLRGLGFETSVIHRQPHLMNRQLDAEGGLHLRQKLEGSGIRFYLEAAVSALHARENNLSAISLRDGRAVPCDLLVFATGINPNVVLAREVGIDCARGVLVDEYLQTSEPHCYALGECSQFRKHCFGLVAPIRAQAAVLARRLAGAEGPAFALEDWPVQLKISGVEIFSAGVLDAVGEQLLLRDTSSGIYRRLVLQGNQLVGAVLVGDKREGTWYAQLIRDATDISRYRSGLMFGKAASEALQSRAVAA